MFFGETVQFPDDMWVWQQLGPAPAAGADGADGGGGGVWMRE